MNYIFLCFLMLESTQLSNFDRPNYTLLSYPYWNLLPLSNLDGDLIYYAPKRHLPRATECVVSITHISAGIFAFPIGRIFTPRIKPCRNLMLKTHISRVVCRYQPLANVAGNSFTAVQVSRVYFFGERYYRVAVSFGSGI